MLIELYRREGTPLRETFGVPYPGYFLHPLAEYEALVTFAGIIDLTHWRVLEVAGRDRVSFLNAMLTNDVATLEENHGCHSTITTVKGKIISELFVFARETDHLLLVSQGDAQETADTLEKHIIREDVSIRDVSSSLGVLAVEGPKAQHIVVRLFRPGPLPKTHLECAELEFEDFKIVVMKNTCTGEDGYHLLIPSQEIERIRSYLVQAARGSDGLLVGGIAWNIRRVEMGLPWYGIDFSGENFPQEARLGHTVSYTKGCFRGQETLGRLHRRGHANRLLVGLYGESDFYGELTRLAADYASQTFDTDDDRLRDRAQKDARTLDLSTLFPPQTPLSPVDDDNQAREKQSGEKSPGWITSVVYSPKLSRLLFLGHVRREISESGHSVTLKAATGETRLTQVDLPLR